MKTCIAYPYLNCGVVNNHIYEDIKSNGFINLAFVVVSVECLKNYHILINYSQNLEFNFYDKNPVISMDYKLIRKSNDTGEIKELEVFNYMVSEVIPTNVDELNTIEPLILNYCDYLDTRADKSYTYIIQLTNIITKNTNFKISNKDISAIVND